MAQRQDLNQGGQGEDDLESVAADYYVVKSVDLDRLKMKTNTDISHLITTDLSRDMLMNTVAEIARAGESQMEAFCEKHLSNFPNYEARVVIGSPGDEILKFAEEQNKGLVRTFHKLLCP